MMKRYYLLNNNIETGPYTKEELVSRGLQPTDFVRGENGSTAWSLAEKMPELNVLLTEEKKMSAGAEKPRYKITANHEVVEITRNGINGVVQPANDKMVQKEVKTFPRIPSAAPKQEPQKPIPATAPPPAKKAANTYTYYPKNSIPKRKKQTGSVNKEVFIPLLIIGAVVAGIWFAYNKFGSKNAANTNNNVAEEIAKPEDTLIAKVNVGVLDTATKHGTKPVAVTTKKTKTTDSAQVNKNKIRKDSLQVAAFSTALAKTEDSLRAIDKASASKGETTGLVTQKKPDSISNIDTSSVKQPKTYNTISDYVRIGLNKNQNGVVKDLRVNVLNISDKLLNIVVVEIGYYDANDNYQKGETLQTSKIEPGKLGQVFVPDSEISSRITYKVSLISGDDVYLMAK
ncbi:MAG: DUF4339 domain-containing protein [Chitinophagaceae bacterium]|jgi:hypothetical protein|nr:DUF4339 domain-containing protein [Chitinophagaceae bacterium]